MLVVGTWWPVIAYRAESPFHFTTSIVPSNSLLLVELQLHPLFSSAPSAPPRFRVQHRNYLKKYFFLPISYQFLTNSVLTE
jgi:hypothetical protein